MKRYTDDEKASRLKEALELISEGSTIAKSCKDTGIQVSQFYAWKSNSGLAKRAKSMTAQTNGSQSQQDPRSLEVTLTWNDMQMTVVVPQSRGMQVLQNLFSA